MLKAEYMLCKDPANPSHMTEMVKAALTGEYLKTAAWMADLLFDLNLQQAKPSFATFVFLKDTYSRLKSLPGPFRPVVRRFR